MDSKAENSTNLQHYYDYHNLLEEIVTYIGVLVVSSLS